MSDLKPCPFCGGEAFTHILGNEIAKGYYIACDECGAKTKVFGYEAEAIEAWNRRIERTAKVERYSFGETLTYDFDGQCECGKWVDALWDYCPSCGAKLEWK